MKRLLGLAAVVASLTLLAACSSEESNRNTGQVVDISVCVASEGVFKPCAKVKINSSTFVDAFCEKGITCQQIKSGDRVVITRESSGALWEVTAIQ